MVPDFSLVLPVYNEAARFPPFADAVRAYLDARYGQAYEVIVVDDGSRDGTAELLKAMLADWPQLVVLRQPVNRGKGAAVRAGMLAARGPLLLFADADGATPITEADKLVAAIGEGAHAAVGSRLAGAAGVTRRRTLSRRLAGRLFAGVARRWLGIPEQDTQCGFKMFRRDVGRKLFSLGRESRYLFDLELLALAHRMGYRVAEVPVNWSEIPGSHLSLWRESPRILSGLWRIARRVRRTAS